jgi:hypothetical protein
MSAIRAVQTAAIATIAIMVAYVGRGRAWLSLIVQKVN